MDLPGSVPIDGHQISRTNAEVALNSDIIHARGAQGAALAAAAAAATAGAAGAAGASRSDGGGDDDDDDSRTNSVVVVKKNQSHHRHSSPSSSLRRIQHAHVVVPQGHGTVGAVVAPAAALNNDNASSSPPPPRIVVSGSESDMRRPPPSLRSCHPVATTANVVQAKEQQQQQQRRKNELRRQPSTSFARIDQLVERLSISRVPDIEAAGFAGHGGVQAANAAHAAQEHSADGNAVAAAAAAAAGDGSPIGNRHSVNRNSVSRVHRVGVQTPSLKILHSDYDNNSDGGDVVSDEEAAAKLEQWRELQRQQLKPSTKREVWSWLMYDAANSVYASVGISLFIPILLSSQAESSQDSDGKVYMGSIPMSPSSVSTFFVSISVFLQAICFVSVGAFADYGSNRRSALVVSAVIGSVLTMLFSTMVDSSLWWLTGILTVLSNVFFGVSIVFYNAFLPLLVEADPDLQAAVFELDAEGAQLRFETNSNRLGTRGFIYGYVSALLLLILCVVIVFAWSPSNEDTPLRFCLFLVGFTWFVCSIPLFLYLENRPGPPLPVGTGKSLFLFSWRRVASTIRQARKLPDTFRFLVAYFIFSDGYSTMSHVAILFGKDELNMGPGELVIVALIVPLIAFIGNYFWLWMHEVKGWSSRRIICWNLVFISTVPLYGLLGLSGVIGIVTPGELYGAAVVFGFNLGAVQSFARSLFAQLIPYGHESEMFSLYEISDKGSSWIGPAVVSVILILFDSMRIALIYVCFALLAPIYLLLKVDVQRGVLQARGENRTVISH